MVPPWGSSLRVGEGVEDGVELESLVDCAVALTSCWVACGVGEFFWFPTQPEVSDNVAKVAQMAATRIMLEAPSS